MKSGGATPLTALALVLSGAIVTITCIISFGPQSNTTYWILGCQVIAGIVTWMGIERLLSALFSKSAPKRQSIGTDSSETIIARDKLLTDNLAAAVLIRDTTGRVSFCSPFIEVLTGYARQHVYDTTGDFFEQIVHQDDRERYLRAMRVAEVGEPFQFRFRFVHRSGLEMWAESRVVPVLNAEQQVIGSLSITLDVTGSVRYERQIEEKNRDLQDFTSMVSHDLKAPLFTVKGMLQILEEDCSKDFPESAREPLNHIHRAAARLEELVLSVLEFAKINSLQDAPESCKLLELFREVVADFAPQLQSCEGHVSFPLEDLIVVADRLKLTRIFTNLIGNAIKYRSPERHLQIQISAERNSSSREIRIFIKDNGLGIPLAKIQDVFRPFQRLHPNVGEGSGVGLASVKRLLEKIGGGISFSSTENMGSTFCVTLRN